MKSVIISVASLLEISAIKEKVNFILKSGRWILTASENSKFSIFDWTQTTADPCFEYLHQKVQQIHSYF